MGKEFSARIITLPEAYEMAYKVARQINDGSEKFNVVVGISRGGLPPSRMICDFLNIKTLTTIQIKHYESGGKAKEKVNITDPVKIALKGKHVLIVDDVNDSGKTLKAAFDNISSLKPGIVKTAVLHEKSNTSFNADYTGAVLSEWKWLIYQWAVTEDLIEFLSSDNLLSKNEEGALKHLAEKYDLQVDRELFKKVLSMKQNYQQD